MQQKVNQNENLDWEKDFDELFNWWLNYKLYNFYCLEDIFILKKHFTEEHKNEFYSSSVKLYKFTPYMYIKKLFWYTKYDNLFDIFCPKQLQINGNFKQSFINVYDKLIELLDQENRRIGYLTRYTFIDKMHELNDIYDLSIPFSHQDDDIE